MAIKDRQAVYAGDQVQAAGITFVCRQTQNLLLIYRSSEVLDPNVWCSAGGKIEHGETPQEAALREVKEEIGFADELLIYPGYVYETPSLRFHNFIGGVDTQFFPKLNWESDGYVWATLQNLPQPLHYGMKAILADTASMAIINQILGNSK